MSATGRILVVDDDAGGRRLTRATLKKAGFDVVEAENGQLALDIMRQGLPDLVLLDVSMPVMDGFTACAELRRLPGSSRVPVVMMTGLDDVGSIERAFEAGATDFITKPINWPILAHRVRYMLRASSAINHLNENQRRLSNAQRIGEMGDWVWDVQGNRVVPSEQAWRIFGQDDPDTSMQPDGFMAFMHPDDSDRVRQACEQAIANGDAFAIEHRIIQASGETRHVHQQVEVIKYDASGRALQLAGAVHDITRRKDSEEQIRRLAYFDPLTGLPNRLLFTEQLLKCIADAERDNKQVAIMFVDLDHFKRVNDTLGHGAGDELLRVVSARLAESVRSIDAISRSPTEVDGSTIARLGGDEFIVMLSELHGAVDAAAVARRLVAALTSPVTIQCTELYVSASVGIAMYPYDGTDIDTLLMNADTAMYRAKEAGRGGFQFYDRSMNARAMERLVMEAMLRRALERDEFVLHYQPRISLATGLIVGAEALIRWQHPERGMVSPREFITLAEETSLVIPIGDWALAEVCRQHASWQASGVAPVPVAVNLASTHLRERNLPELITRVLKEHAVPASCLEIEVTESMLMADPELSVATAVRLNEIGVRLSIDDFGTGYSSLSYLKKLPIAALKIDQSFVRDLASDPDDAAIITAIIAMAHSLKLKVVAEGVETQAQRDFLKAQGCDEFQGYLVSRPVDAEAFARLMEQQRSGLLALPAPGSTAEDWQSAELRDCPSELECQDTTRFRGRVLLADDSGVNRFVARKMLESLGCEFDIVRDGAEALLAFQGAAYDIVLMDCQMPVKDGFAAAREIRAWELAQSQPRRIPIVALTANGSPGYAATCRAAGMDDHMAKPYSRGQLSAMMTRWLPEHLVKAADESVSGWLTRLATLTALPIAPSLDRKALDSIRELDESGRFSVLAEFVGIYIGEAEQHLARLSAALECKDAAELERVAHAFKSASQNVGAVQLGEICRQLERQGKAGELGGAVELVRAIERHFEMIRPVLLAEGTEPA